VSGTKAFHDLCSSTLRGRNQILEIGAGPSNETSDYLAALGQLTGVDISNEIAGNRALKQWRVFDGRNLPFEDNSFDGCVSNWVLEHVEFPTEHLKEVHRVLKPGGVYCFRTMNAMHYVGAIANFSPQWFHEAVANRVRGLSAEAHAPYPTFYRCNTLRAVFRNSESSGFSRVSVTAYEAEPSYGRASRILFYPMLAWERAVNASQTLQFLRAGIFGNLVK
jgi:ubiquinone/menaquinone biosynthesis C-methylase UbiE